jgi:type VI secretion system protein VasG
MLAVDLRALVGKLNDVCRQALDAALGLTVSRTHFNAEIEHWLLKLLDANDSDFIHILNHFELDRGLVAAELNKTLDRLKRGNARAPELSPQLVTLAREAWLVASLEGRAGRIRSGHLIAALLTDDTLALQTRRSSGELGRVPGEQLRREFVKICGDSSEAAAAAAAPVADSAPASPDAGTPGSGETPALDQFTIDLTAQAKAGKIDPILGRDAEIRQVIDILSRRRQNNPILTGEPGVGKTAVVEGFALKVFQKDVPDSLLGVAVRTLDLGLLQAGAGVKGEFENRLKQVIDEVRASVQPIILFIDEAHTLIGAGGAAGQNDAANLLKPALARGDLRTIAATTWAEYKKYFERDAALTRRFQVVKVEEPSEPVAVAMLRGLVGTLEKHHKVRILDEALVEAVRLSHRYIPARQLPDKAVSLLDTACARVNMSLTSIPAAIEDLRRAIELDGSTLDILRREMVTGGAHDSTVAELEQRRTEAGEKLATLEQRWQTEKTLVGQIQTLRGSLEAPGEANPEQIAAWKKDLTLRTLELRELQGEAPLLQPVVDGQAVAEVVAAWTGIPVGRMVSNEIRTVLTLDDKLRERIIGQDQALVAIAEAVRTSRAKLADARKPIGVFLMVGTSGVGKTETALALSELLYGGEQNMTVINMSEFKEEHKISMLLGSPPGYVGYGEGGVLTEAVRRRPYGVVLLDEMEKAHPGIQDVFYQVFDKGMLRDGEGRDIDFKNTIVIMTSNAGTDLIASLCADPETRPDAKGLAEALRPELLKTFKPAFLGRTTLVPYFPLAEDIIRQIVALQLRRIQKRVIENYKAQFSWDPALVEGIARRCTESESGARNIERILAQGLLPELSGLLLERMAEGQSISSIQVSLGEESKFQYQIA